MTLNTDYYKARLEELREELLAELAVAGPHPESGHGYSTHPADHGTDAFEQMAGIAVRRNDERLLYEIERALTRIEENRYGICRDCGQLIDRARLKVIPYARYCLDCANKHSKG